MLLRILTAACVGFTLIAGPAVAENLALARNSMLLFGGPSPAYPRIGLISWGQGLKVLNCQIESLWCEVVADGQRGWVPAQAVEWPAGGARKVFRKWFTPMRVTI